VDIGKEKEVVTVEPADDPFDRDRPSEPVEHPVEPEVVPASVSYVRPADGQNPCCRGMDRCAPSQAEGWGQAASTQRSA
jgi:hypothetical protein